jgi:hypothetical protein
MCESALNGYRRDTEEARRCVALLLHQCGATGTVPVDRMRDLQFQHLKTVNLCDASEGVQRLKYALDLTILRF